MKLKVIVPITTKALEEETKKEIAKIGLPGVDIEVERIEYGTASIESMYDEMLCAPGIIKVAERAQAHGFDGVFIDCMGDPALDAVRERLDIPVVGAARPCMLYAADLASKFTIVTVVENVIGMFENQARGLGLRDKLASVRTTDIPVLDLADKEKTVKALVGESVRAIEEDGAHAIILGCTGMMGVAEDLGKALEQKGYEVPVVYPVPTAIRYLETLISLKLVQSKKTYMSPPDKDRNLLERL